MSKLSKRDTILLALIGAAVVLGGLFWFYVKPARADLAATKVQTADAQGRVDQLTTELQKLQAAASRPAKTSIADELRLAKAYPYSEEIPVTILQVEELAKQTHVELGPMTPSDGTDYAGVTGTPFSIAVTGKFFDVQDFMYRLHNRVHLDGAGNLKISGRLFAITKASLSPGGDAAATDVATANTKDAPITATITVVAFSRSAAGGAGTAAATDSTGGNPQ
jgi:hypothetical protein